MLRGDCSRKGFEHGVLNFLIHLQILGQDAADPAARQAVHSCIPLLLAVPCLLISLPHFCTHC